MLIDTSSFFELTSKTLSEASFNRQLLLKSGDKINADMWAEFHRILTHAHAEMHKPQLIAIALQNTTINRA